MIKGRQKKANPPTPTPPPPPPPPPPPLPLPPTPILPHFIYWKSIGLGRWREARDAHESFKCSCTTSIQTESAEIATCIHFDTSAPIWFRFFCCCCCPLPVVNCPRWVYSFAAGHRWHHRRPPPVAPLLCSSLVSAVGYSNSSSISFEPRVMVPRRQSYSTRNISVSLWQTAV